MSRQTTLMCVKRTKGKFTHFTTAKWSKRNHSNHKVNIWLLCILTHKHFSVILLLPLFAKTCLNEKIIIYNINHYLQNCTVSLVSWNDTLGQEIAFKWRFFFSYSSFSRVALPEEECAFSLFLFPQQRERQGLVLTAALMEGLKLWRYLRKLEDIFQCFFSNCKPVCVLVREVCDLRGSKKFQTQK